MENNDLASRPLGPRRGSGLRPLSASRTALLERLRGQPEPLTQAALVSATGLHPNTVREHLTALVRRGLVRRHSAEPSGRGRPAWLYELTDEPETEGYAGLAASLAAAIARTSPHPLDAAAAAGEEWGRELVSSRGSAARNPEEARELILEMLDDLGFSPESEPHRPSEVRLTRCPLLAAAHRHPEIVCGVHLGIVRGALTEHGADPEGAALAPFAEPGACRLVVPPLDDR